MTQSVTELDIFIGAATSLLGIEIDPSWLEPIRFHLEMSLRMARLVEAFVLPDEAEPAPVFAA